MRMQRRVEGKVKEKQNREKIGYHILIVIVENCLC